MQFFYKQIQAMAEENEAIAALVAMWPFVLAFFAAVIGYSLLVKSRRNVAAQRSGDGATLGVSTRLSDADLAAYQVDGAAAPEPKGPTVNMDDFFSNADRRAELNGQAPPDPSPAMTDLQVQAGAELVHRELGVRIGDAPAPEDAARVGAAADLMERRMADLQATAQPANRRPEPIFPLPQIDELPAPEPGEPEPTREATTRVVAYLKALEANQKDDPFYVPSTLDLQVRDAFHCQSRMASAFAGHLRKGPKPDTLARYADNAQHLGAHDLAAILKLCHRLTDMVADPGFPPYHEEDDQWNDVLETADRLQDMFAVVNKRDGSTGRLVSLADRLISANA